MSYSYKPIPNQAYPGAPAPAPVPVAAAPAAAQQPCNCRFPRLRAMKEAVKSVVCDQPSVLHAETHHAEYPIQGGYTAPMALEVITFPELDEHVPQGEILRTIAGINAILREHGPRYHLPIYVGTTVLLVAGGVVVGVIAAVAAGIYFKVKKNRATAIVENFLRAENEKPCYQQAGIRWNMGLRGVQMEYTAWELVESPNAPVAVAPMPQQEKTPAPVAAVPAYSPMPAPAPQMYPTLPPQQPIPTPALYYAAPVAPAVVPNAVPVVAPAPVAPQPVGMTYEQQVAFALQQSLHQQ